MNFPESDYFGIMKHAMCIIYDISHTIRIGPFLFCLDRFWFLLQSSQSVRRAKRGFMCGCALSNHSHPPSSKKLLRIDTTHTTLSTRLSSWMNFTLMKYLNVLLLISTISLLHKCPRYCKIMHVCIFQRVSG